METENNNVLSLGEKCKEEIKTELGVGSFDDAMKIANSKTANNFFKSQMLRNKLGLILGVSDGGFGHAAWENLNSHGMNMIAVQKDQKAQFNKKLIPMFQDEARKTGTKIIAINCNAFNPISKELVLRLIPVFSKIDTEGANKILKEIEAAHKDKLYSKKAKIAALLNKGGGGIEAEKIPYKDICSIAMEDYPGGMAELQLKKKASIQIEVIDERWDKENTENKLTYFFEAIALGACKMFAMANKPGYRKAAVEKLASVLGQSEELVQKAIDKAFHEMDAYSLYGVVDPGAVGENGKDKLMRDLPLESVNEIGYAKTIKAMGTSYREWTVEIMNRDLNASFFRSMMATSGGNDKNFPAYASEAEAKVIAERSVKTLSHELGSQGLATIAIECGITFSQALTGIPWSHFLSAFAVLASSSGKVTTAKRAMFSIPYLCLPGSAHETGYTKKVDGGESSSLAL